MIRHPETSGTHAAEQDTPLSLFRRVKARLARSFLSDVGTASVEFVICVPAIMMIFMASIESGAFMTRLIMLERSVDNVMRELRLGQIPNPTVALLKDQICDGSLIVKDCQANITIDLRPVSTTNWAFPAGAVECVDRDSNISPATTFNPGAVQDIMMVRVCVIQNAIFPFAGIGLRLAQDASGGLALTTTTAFVNEP
ncbi:TadE/TadG family type IV pilus assembly protein [Pseudorhodobacter ferrugineus]|uniref:TadE/TadG family type IV pilus assembly protein n=1 Tax=Pseudorhodobacter ferrugineus TaxID=77008 RepID=UPI0003B40579|nr:TadE family protein [Pseudorhodobacter ferrugineus]